MLCTCQTDTLSTEVASNLCIVWSISIGAYLQLGVLVAEVHQLLEVTTQLSSLGGNLASINLTGSTIQRDIVTLLIYNAVNLDSLVLVANIQRTYTADAALTHTTSHNGSMRGHTTTSSQDTLGCRHTCEVFWRGLDTNENYLVTILVPILSIVSVEHNLTTGSTWRCGQTLGNNLGTGQSLLVEDGVQQFVELLRLATHDSGFLVNLTLVQQVDGNLYHSSTCALTVTGLEEPQFALLNGELHILHITIVLLELLLNAVQLLIDLRHCLLHRRILGYALSLRDACTLSPTLATQLGNLLRSTNTGNNILTLCINQIFTIEYVLTISGITAEAYTSSRGVAHVTEYHCHNRYGCTPLVGNTFHLTIQDSTLVHPAAEHSTDGTPQLLDRIVGEVLACALLDGSLEQLNQFLQVFY